MTNLSDTQRILLSTASQRDSGSILPLPACLKPGGGTAKAVAALLKRGFAEERETSEAAAVHRSDGDRRLGLFVTTAGLAVLGLQPDIADGDQPSTGECVAAAAAPAAKTGTTAAVLELLGRPVGATMPELIAATGWLPHTTRAALTGLRKKGHALERSKRGEATCYTLVSAS